MKFTVCQSGVPIGSLETLSHGSTFQYRNPRAAAIAPSIPVRDEPYTFQALPAFVQALLPIGKRAIDGMKALHIANDEENMAQKLTVETVGDLTIVPDPADRVQSTGEDDTGEIMRSGALPGVLVFESAQDIAAFLESGVMETAIRQCESSTGCGGTFRKCFAVTADGSYIVKYYGNSVAAGLDRILPVLEDATAAVASKVGLPTASTYLTNRCLVVRRFDRHPEPTGSMKKIGVSHLCDLLDSRDPVFGGSWDAVAKRLAALPQDVLSDVSRLDLFKQAIFAWVIGDSDAHAQNFAFIRCLTVGQQYPGFNTWLPSPCYDKLPSRFLTGDQDETALPVNGRRAKVRPQDWLLVIRRALSHCTPETEKAVLKFMSECVQATQHLPELMESSGLQKEAKKMTAYLQDIQQRVEVCRQASAEQRVDPDLDKISTLKTAEDILGRSK